MVTGGELEAEAASLMRRAGQKFTSGRRSMLDALVKLGRPATIPELLAVTPGLAMSSAYRHLTVLEQAGVVRRIILGGDDHARFELAEVLTEHHHHHLICSRCGAVDDFTVPAKLERAVERVARRSRGDHGVQGDRSPLRPDRPVRALLRRGLAGHELQQFAQQPGGGAPDDVVG